MNESDWLEGADALPMLEFLHGKASERKFRLFAVSAYRYIWQWIKDATSREAIEVADRFAERLASHRELGLARLSAYTNYLNSYADAIFAYAVADLDAAHAAIIAARDVASIQSGAELIELLRDIFGNPFRPVALDRAWLTSTVTMLAQAAYEDRRLPAGTLDPDRLAILADALEDAGCTDEAILSHCRNPGRHGRGCWPVDLLLERS